MKLLLPFLLILIACAPQQAPQETDALATPELITFEKYEQLAPLLQKQDDITYVVNFWATWCKPCVKELPYFEDLHNFYKGKKVKVLLVSLDFPNQIQSKLIPFIKDKQLKSQVVAFIDSDMNSWIPKIAEEWSGSIPATLIYKNSQRAFYEQSFDSFEELNNLIKPFTTLEQ